MDDWKNIKKEEGYLSEHEKHFTLGGALLLSLAFLIREYKDYKKTLCIMK